MTTSALRVRMGGGSRAYTAADYRRLAAWYDRLGRDYAHAIDQRTPARTPAAAAEREQLRHHYTTAMRTADRFAAMADQREARGR